MMRIPIISWLLIPAATLTICALPLNAGAGEKSRIAVFVGPNVRDGFVDVDRGTLDSIGDIKAELRRVRRLSVVNSREEATVALVVLGRRHSGTAGAIAVTNPSVAVGTTATPTVTTMVPVRGRAIDTRLEVGDYSRIITSERESGGAWRFVARRVVDDLMAWIDANRSRLIVNGAK
jgi:hypothetical protein